MTSAIFLPPAHVLRLELPSPQAFPYESVLPQLTADSRVTTSVLNTLRNRIAAACVSKNATQYVQDATAFLGPLRGFLAAMEGVTVDTVSRTTVVWHVPLAKGGVAFVRNINFDRAMALLAVAYGHRATAAAALAAAGGDCDAHAYGAACRELGAAAGVFDYCSTLPLASWAGGVALPELDQRACKALAGLCRAEEDNLKLHKAILRGAKPAATVKVAVGVARAARAVADAFRALAGAYSAAPALDAVEKYATALGALALAYAAESLGRATLDQGRPGVAVAYARAAVAERAGDRFLACPPLAALAPDFIRDCREKLAAFDAVARRLEDDNANAFRDVVLQRDAVFPEPLSLAKAEPYDEPAPVRTNLTFAHGMYCTVQ